MLHPATIDAVKAYSEIVTVISEYVPLKKRGRNYIGLCPFHSEKSPSFTVSPDKHIWHCFGCHESGNLIGFMMKIDNLNFIDAVKAIAERAGIEIRETETPQKSRQSDTQDSILAVLHDAQKLMETYLESDAKTQSYIQERGLSADIQTQFELGALPIGVDLMDALLKKGHREAALHPSGLFYQTDQGVWVPRFRQRLIFPIWDLKGRTVGFAGRIVEPGSSAAKYVNSPETEVFNKRRLLYAIHKAKSAIQKSGYALLMEGYMDVLLAHQFGFKEAVATMGTAVTTHHAQLLSRLTQKVILAMDNDAAGQAAMTNSYDTLKQYGFEISVLQLEEKDPADCLLKEGKGAFQTRIQNSQPFIAFKLAQLVQEKDRLSIEEKARRVDEFLPFLRQEKDLIVQNFYIGKLAEGLALQPELIQARVKNRSITANADAKPRWKPEKTKYQKAEDMLMTLAAVNPALRSKLTEFGLAEMVLDPMHQAMIKIILESSASAAELIEALEDPKWKTHLSHLLVENSLDTDAASVWMEYATMLRSYSRTQRIQEIKSQIKVLEQRHEDDKVTALLEELTDLMRT